MKKKGFLFGAFILIVAGLISKMIGAVYKIPLIHLMGTEGLGLFQLVYPIYSLFLVLASSGVAVSLSKMISREQSNGQTKNVRMILKSSLVWMTLLGFLFCGVLFLLAPVICGVQQNPTAVVCYYAVAPAILFACLLVVFRGYFQGLQNMVPSAITQIVEQVTKLAASLLLVKLFLPYGLVYAVSGALLGVSLSELISFIIILIIYALRKDKRKEIKVEQSSESLTFKQASSKLFHESLPIMFNAIIFPIAGAVDSLMIVFLLSRAGLMDMTAISLYGLNSGVVGSVVAAPSIIAVAISTALLPSISASFQKHDLDDCRRKSKIAFKMVWYISVPLVVILILLSGQITRFLYANGLRTVGIDEIKIASDLLKLSAISVIYVGFLDLTTSVLQAMNKSYLPVKNLLFSTIIRFAAMFVLVTMPKINIYGLVLADIICLSVAVLLNLKDMRRYLNLSFDWKNFILVPLLSVLVMSGVVEACLKALTGLMAERILTVIVIMVGVLLYGVCVFVLKGFQRDELRLFLKQKSNKNTEK